MSSTLLHPWVLIADTASPEWLDHSAGVVYHSVGVVPEWWGTTPATFHRDNKKPPEAVHCASRTPMGAVGPPDTETTTPVHPLVLVYSKRSPARSCAPCGSPLPRKAIRMAPGATGRLNMAFGTLHAPPPSSRLVGPQAGLVEEGPVP